MRSVCINTRGQAQIQSKSAQDMWDEQVNNENTPHSTNMQKQHRAAFRVQWLVDPHWAWLSKSRSLNNASRNAWGSLPLVNICWRILCAASTCPCGDVSTEKLVLLSDLGVTPHTEQEGYSVLAHSAAICLAVIDSFNDALFPTRPTHVRDISGILRGSVAY